MDATGNSRAADERLAVHELTLAWRDGREESVRTNGDETVLDAAEWAGVSLPFGCLTGVYDLHRTGTRGVTSSMAACRGR